VSAADFYDALAPAYHLNYADWEASIARQAAALHAVLGARGVAPGSTVLDAACGVGTQSLGLAALGYRVAGSDLSAGAVARARTEAEARGLGIPFGVADLRDLASVHAREFDVVIACDNSIPHLLSDAEIAAAFGQMWRCTTPGGTCLVSVRDYDAIDRAGVQSRPPVVHAGAEGLRILFQVWEFHGQHYDLAMYVVHDTREQPPAVQVMRTRYYAVGIPTLIELMRRAGFQDVQRLDEPFYQPIVIGRRPG
jgi:SAM-dependent methyltransferase